MPSDETRLLLAEIDGNGAIQQYIQEACDDLYSITQRMSLYSCFEMAQCQTPIPIMCNMRGVNVGVVGLDTNSKEWCRNLQYHHTMQFLMNLATVQNITHPGSVRVCDVGTVFSHGNIRERCAMMMNLLCHDKKYNIMQWLLVHVDTMPSYALAAMDSSSSVSNTFPSPPASSWCSSSALPNIGPGSTLPACLDVWQLNQYKHALGIGKAISSQHTENHAKRDMRKALCKLVNCPRKNTRTVRPLGMQNTFALPVQDAMPLLSWRERALHSSVCCKAACLAAGGATGPGKNRRKNPLLQCVVTTVGRAPIEQCHPAHSADSANSAQGPARAAGATTAAGIQRQQGSDRLPWLTGRMCWQMQPGSTFVEHASRLGEEMVAGPSGHTNALMTFMRIFLKFDVEKWTLICIVWLVGADHHSVFEVLTAASRHGLPYSREMKSLEFAWALVRACGERCAATV